MFLRILVNSPWQIFRHKFEIIITDDMELATKFHGLNFYHLVLIGIT